MKRRLIISGLLILLANMRFVVAQMDPTAKNAILTLLLSKPISEKVFVDYPEGRWTGPFDLPGGSYVFIPPNSIFRSVYPTILKEMPYTIGTDSLLNMRTLYRDSLRGIFITQDVSFELFIVFEKIDLQPDDGCIKFYTTSRRNREEYKDRYISVTSEMVRTDGHWSVLKLKIEPITWTDYFK